MLVATTHSYWPPLVEHLNYYSVKLFVVVLVTRTTFTSERLKSVTLCFSPSSPSLSSSIGWQSEEMCFTTILNISVSENDDRLTRTSKALVFFFVIILSCFSSSLICFLVFVLSNQVIRCSNNSMAKPLFSPKVLSELLFLQLLNLWFWILMQLLRSNNN